MHCLRRHRSLAQKLRRATAVWDLVRASCDKWFRALVSVHVAVERWLSMRAGEPEQLCNVPLEFEAVMA